MNYDPPYLTASLGAVETRSVDPSRAAYFKSKKGQRQLRKAEPAGPLLTAQDIAARARLDKLRASIDETDAWLASR